MDYSELINDFIDGRLASEKENELFLALSSDDELRSELKQSLAIENAMKSDAASLTPSAGATAAVFSRLGFQTPNIAPQETPWTKLKSNIADVYSRFASYALTAAITSIATVLIMLALYNPDTKDSDIGNNQARQAVKGLPTTTSYEMKDIGQELDLLVVTPPEQSRAFEDSKQNNYLQGYSDGMAEAKRNFGNDIMAAREELATLRNALDSFVENHAKEDVASEIKKIQTPDLMVLPSSQLALQQSHSFIYVPVDNRPSDRTTNLNFMNFEKVGLELEFRGSDYWMFPKATVGEATAPKFNNSGISLYYELLDDLQIGFDLRQEYFYQEYDAASDERLIRYMQQPNLVTYSLAARYSFLTVSNISAFAEIQGGANIAGPTGRAAIGLKYAPNEHYNFILGGEGSALLFHHGNKSYLAPKIGLFYGAAFKF